MVTERNYAEDSKLNFVEEPVRNVLSELSNQLSINFIYSDAIIENRKVSCNLTNLSANTAIKKLLSLLNVSYKLINENTYVLYIAPVQNNIHNKKNDTRVTIKKAPVFFPPKMLTDAKIPYPDQAIKKGFEGSVDMDLLISEKGEVEIVKIQKSSNSEILDQAVIEYAKNIRFSPARKDSHPIPVWSKWKVVFDLVPSDTTYSEFILKNTLNE